MDGFPAGKASWGPWVLESGWERPGQGGGAGGEGQHPPGLHGGEGLSEWGA